MAINADKTHLWKADIAQSIDFYNDWFLRFAPGTYRKQRVIRINDPLTKIALQKKQLAALKRWLLRHGYKETSSDEVSDLDAMPPGTFTFRRVLFAEKKKTPVNIPIDCVLKPIHAGKRDLPLVIEAKSSGNATATVRWCKKEALKFTQLKERYGKKSNSFCFSAGTSTPAISDTRRLRGSTGFGSIGWVIWAGFWSRVTKSVRHQ